MTVDELMAWVRRENFNLAEEKMARILERARRRAASSCDDTCLCSLCRKEWGAIEHKSAAHCAHFRQIVWQARGIKSVTDAGTFSAYGAIFDQDPDSPGDCVGDLIYPGAFKDHWGSSVPLLWMHEPHSPCGRCFDLAEDSYGLRFSGRLELGSVRGREVHSFLRSGNLDAFSIGFSLPHEDGWKYRPNHDTGRVLKRVRLHEISVVSMPCNGAARIQ